MNIQTLKGFRDFLGPQARKRQYVINTFRKVFESFGFEGMETPVLEYEEILMGKYGEEGDKLMYRFEDNGGRRVAMRYDQTVPLARVVAEYQNELPIPFKRFQIQNVWRAENTQKGRYREFMQCDVDTVGTSSPLADAEVIATAVNALEKLGFLNYKVLVNDRTIFEGLPTGAITAIDKLKKIGTDEVCKELVERGVTSSKEEARNLLQSITDTKPTGNLEQILSQLELLEIKNVEFSPALARGLDYYTGLIFEIEIPEYPVGSVCGGGRYDNLIGMFAGRQIPAVGFAFGFDRTIEAMEALSIFPETVNSASAQVLVTLFNKELEQKTLEVASLVRTSGIAVDVYPDEAKMEKQLKYADAKQIPFAVIIGPDEAARNMVTVKNLKTREQTQLPLDQLTTFFSK
ncbi:MAG: histidine--tRNA ligase [Patescibacteria group bacterium]|nr:histidine--tRNA ligase [Patescibacteria group bacterium]MDE2590061.1 histidine--tRNA ligase [Patescibacteria group bacterium]